MRWMRDLIAVLTVVALVGGYLYVQRQQRDKEAVIARAESDLRRMDLEVKYRAASKSTELNARGWPVTIDPAWFDGRAPDNPFVDGDHPWVEVAGTSQADLTHPPVRLLLDNTLAAFWYNPYQGVVRARVPVMVSDEDATQLYNRINQTSLPTIFSREMPVQQLTPKPVAAAATTEQTAAAQDAAPSADKDAGKSVFGLFKVDRKKTTKRK